MPETMQKSTGVIKRGITRRSFLKTTAAVGGIAALSGTAFGCSSLSSISGQPTNKGEEIIQGVCRPNCFGFCHVNVHLRDGVVVKTSLAPYYHNPEYTRICQRGLSHVHRIYDPERLKYPMRRAEGTERGAGEWERISWDDAITEIAENIKKYQDEYGLQAFAKLSCSGNYGQLTNNMYGRLFSLVQACSIDSNVDLATYFSGQRINGGINECNEVSDIVNSKTIITYGANVTDAQVHTWHFIKEAQQNGTKLVVVDPTFTQIASKADLWVPIRPGTDMVLYMGLMNIILEKDAVDESFMANSTVAPFMVRSDTGKFLRRSDIGIEPDKTGELDLAGEEILNDPYLVLDNKTLVEADAATKPALEAKYDLDGVQCRTAYSLLLDEIAKYPPDVVSRMTDIPTKTLYELADICIDGPVYHLLAYGSAAYSNGIHVMASGTIMSALTGNLCKPGATFGNSYPVYTGINYGFASPIVNETPTIQALDWAEVMNTGKHMGKDFPVKMLYVFCANPLNTYCSTNTFLENIWPKLDFVVVADSQMTDTARYADLILPTSQHFEQFDFCSDGPTWNLHYCEKAIDPPFEAKTDADIVRLLSKQLGFEKYFNMNDEEALVEIFETEAGSAAGITMKALKEHGDLRYSTADPYIPWPDGKGFTTPSGRLEFYNEEPKVRAATSITPSKERIESERLPHWFPPFEAWHENEIMKKYPLQIMSERPRWRVHSQFYNVHMLRELDTEPIVKINPADAEARGIADGSYVECYNDRGHSVAKAVFSEAIRPGTLVYPKGWQISQHKAGCWSELLSVEFDVFAVNSNFMDVVCEIRSWSGRGEQ